MALKNTKTESCGGKNKSRHFTRTEVKTSSRKARRLLDKAGATELDHAEFAEVSKEAGREAMLAQCERFGGNAGRKSAEAMSTDEIVDVCWALYKIGNAQVARRAAGKHAVGRE